MVGNDECSTMVIMFVGVEGSTKLYEKEGGQKAQHIIERCLSIVSETVKNLSKNYLNITREFDKISIKGDESTNGTFLNMNNISDVFLRREESPLIGIGEIVLGESTRKQAIRYICL